MDQADIKEYLAIRREVATTQSHLKKLRTEMKEKENIIALALAENDADFIEYGPVRLEKKTSTRRFRKPKSQQVKDLAELLASWGIDESKMRVTEIYQCMQKEPEERSRLSMKLQN